MGSNKKSLRPTRRRSMKGKYSFQRDDDVGVVFVWLGKADDVDEGIEAESMGLWKGWRVLHDSVRASSVGDGDGGRRKQRRRSRADSPPPSAVQCVHPVCCEPPPSQVRPRHPDFLPHFTVLSPPDVLPHRYWFWRQLVPGAAHCRPRIIVSPPTIPSVQLLRPSPFRPNHPFFPDLHPPTFKWQWW